MRVVRAAAVGVVLLLVSALLLPARQVASRPTQQHAAGEGQQADPLTFGFGSLARSMRSCWPACHTHPRCSLGNKQPLTLRAMRQPSSCAHSNSSHPVVASTTTTTTNTTSALYSNMFVPSCTPFTVPLSFVLLSLCTYMPPSPLPSAPPPAAPLDAAELSRRRQKPVVIVLGTAGDELGACHPSM